jgi:serine protease Do
MKRYFTTRLLVAGVALLTLPGLAVAQKEKEKNKDKDSKKQTQQIIITRTGDPDEKTVIEINGDKVKINGKDASDGKNENVTVRTHSWPDFNRNWSSDNFNFNFDEDNKMSLFSEDANRAMLGVVTDEDEEGAKITSITKESGAEKAGLKVGDVITKIGDDDIEDADDVSQAVREHKPGDKIDVTVLRNGKEQKLTAELGKWKGVRINNLNPMVAPTIPGEPFRSFSYSRSGAPKLGLSVQDTDDGNGVKVLQVAEESNAAKAGVKKDDIITHINDEQVENTDDVVRSMRDNHKEAMVKLQLLRGGKPQTIEVRIPRKLKTTDL